VAGRNDTLSADRIVIRIADVEDLSIAVTMLAAAGC
jgi:hypothetical protein